MLRTTETEETHPAKASLTALESQKEVDPILQDQELAELTECLEAARVRVKSRHKVMRGSLAAVSGVILAASLSMFYALAHGITPDPWVSILLGLGSNLGAGAVAVGGFLWVRRSRLAERAAARSLTEREDVRVTASLIDTLGWMEDKALRTELWQALGHLLPQLTEDEAWELGKERHGLLASWIQAWDHPLTRRQYAGLGNQPLLGMLGVMAHVGQDRFQVGDQPIKVTFALLPTLEKWAEGKGAGQDPTVQHAAAACREAIQQKMALAKSSEHLLRASHPTLASPETLLRPAQSTEQTDPQELLRPDLSE